ncbi:MAG: UvrD-helicase domain-containing protein [Mobilitalea sp.]
MSWTEAQQKVIDTRNKNLLVSAAAGSGKTAVLVERIITMISEGDKPLDIDRLLVVTFTNAAAAEMRERIGKAIDAKLQLQPDNLHLQKQMSLLQSAQITTIHSFCLNVIRNYFHRIDLDPSFKIAEESEITLMKSDVVQDMLERWYEEGSEEFHSFVESYSRSKSDEPLEGLILQLYNFSMSAPWPERWLKDKEKVFDIQTLEEMYESAWMQQLMDYIQSVLGDLSQKNAMAIRVCQEEGGPSAYLSALMSDRDMLNQFRKVNSYQEGATVFSAVSFERLSNKKDATVLDWKKDKVKTLREEVKKGMKDISTQFFFQTPEEMLSDIMAVKPVMQVLFQLTLEFMDQFAKKKEEKNLIDFNDLEHFALKILIDGETSLPTPAAKELSEIFEEILIDEYQDSNMVQETILRSISREDDGVPNRFMVGDVKQSIYKFRLAMPEIFMEKYAKYRNIDIDQDGSINLYQKIDLDKNFRSRDGVLQYVNQIFEQIMQQSIGGIHYDEAAALKYGGLYDGPLLDLSGNAEKYDSINIESRIAKEVDLLLITEEDLDTAEQDILLLNELKDVIQEDLDQATVVDHPDEVEYTKKEMEARAIVRKIRELTDPDTGMLVTDKATKKLRPANYGDIVILLRSMSNWSEVFVNTLMQEGIPAYADTGTGYFQTLEIRAVLNMLKIIDNPRQDIPLVGVLYSPMVGLTTTELAMVRTANRTNGMYQALLQYVEENEEGELKEKLSRFLEQFTYLRSLVNHTPIHELIGIVLELTGYYYYAFAMPGGVQRRANLDMLISRAVRFENSSYSGLFHFIRYIEKLQKYEVDFGEASVAGGQEDTVRIMSIHKSKGLEFPVVFVAGMSKQFNTQDIRSSVVLHNEIGIGPEYIDSVQRTKIPTLIKKAIQKKMQIENLGEELRVLYVAMTRAKEKLILTGYIKSLKCMEEKEFTFFELLSAKSYMDWVLPAMLNRMGVTEELLKTPYTAANTGMQIQVISHLELLQGEITKQLFLELDQESLMGIPSDITYDTELKDEIKSRFGYQYPYANETGLKIKMTVSELKRLGQELDEEDSVSLFDGRKDAAIAGKSNIEDDIESIFENTSNTEFETKLPGVEAYIPEFIQQKQTTMSGTDRGTLYHKVLEILDLTKINTKDELKKELELIIQQGRMKQEEMNRLNTTYILGFIFSKVADRMRKAQINHKLYKEKQFVMGIKASEVLKEFDSQELVLIQGIIDVYFEEEDGIVLLDYKSDLVKTEKELIKRYKVQLDYYQRALEQMLGKRVKERIIYSLSLGKEISL